jgi:hypothetical protein
MTSTSRARILAGVISLVTAAAARTAAADTVVQVPVDSIIDGRTVSTVSGTTITPWSAGQGVDGDGNADGFVTNAVETILATQGKTVGGKVGVALPDDGMFPANTRHPAIALHFSNAAPTTSPQTHQIYISATRGPQMFQFDVPQAIYSKMFVIITASEGGAKLAITLNYAGGAAPMTQTVMLPDYGIGGAGANDPVFFNLIAGMRKWNATDQEGDTTTHTITGIELNPSATAMLASIKVEKMNGSHCVFWGATGIATSAVTTGTGGSGGGAGTGGATDGGAAGATDAGGGAGAGGATGAAGATGAGGAAGTAGAAGTGATGAGGTNGGAGSGATGAGGSTGAAGSGATGTAGTTGNAGAIGTTGAGGTTPPKHGSGGGCALAGAPAHEAAWLLLAAAALAIVIARRRP